MPATAFAASRSAETAAAEPALRFGRRYREDVTLRDGSRARIVTLKSAHAPQLSRGFDQLSPRSRYLRFLAFRPALSPDQLRYLTDTDGLHHFALAAAVETEPGVFHEAAVGRIVAVANAPGWIEPAITVIDAFQGLGLGTLLAERLIAAARERRYTGMRAEVLRENGTILKLIRHAGLATTMRSFGPVVEIEAPFAEH